jgi:hypothetical protein
MADPALKVVVIVEDRLRFTQLLGEAVGRAFPGVSVALAVSWSHASRFHSMPPSSYLVVPMTHAEALALDDRQWEQVSAVLVDTHDTEREWHGFVTGSQVRQPVYAGGEVARRLLELPSRRLRVICYSSQLDNPLVKVLLWQQTHHGRADAYYLAEALAQPNILRSALVDPIPRGQVEAPTDRDFAMLGLNAAAPLYRVLAAANENRERWELVSGIKTYAEATAGARKWLLRQAAALGTGEPKRWGKGESVLRMLRRAASGSATPPEPD